MKAKVKETGKWITVNPCNDGFYEVGTHDIYEPDELEFAAEFDWQSFRRETASNAMCAIITANPDGVYPDPEEIAEMAVLYADELIDSLKKQ